MSEEELEDDWNGDEEETMEVPSLVPTTQPVPAEKVEKSLSSVSAVLAQHEAEEEVDEDEEEAHASRAALEEALVRFYARVNPGNLHKVGVLASKFNENRWELWQQMSKKYELRPEESSELWEQVFADRCSAALCVLFGVESIPEIPETPLSLRSRVWRDLLVRGSRDEYTQFSRELGTETAQIVSQDVARTFQEIGFFHDENRREALKTILTTACRICSMDYVQGMNTLAGILYYVLRNEADAFWAFRAVTAELMDVFLAEADSTNTGILSQIDSVAEMLFEHRPALFKRLAAIEFPLATLVVRWLSTLLCADLPLPDAMQVADLCWVALQGDPGTLRRFSLCLCVAYLSQMETELQECETGAAAAVLADSFAKSHAGFDVQRLLRDATTIFAFESRLAGSYFYAPHNDFMDAMADAIAAAKHQLANAWIDGGAPGAIEVAAERGEEVARVAAQWVRQLGGA